MKIYKENGLWSVDGENDLILCTQPSGEPLFRSADGDGDMPFMVYNCNFYFIGSSLFKKLGALWYAIKFIFIYSGKGR